MSKSRVGTLMYVGDDEDLAPPPKKWWVGAGVGAAAYGAGMSPLSALLVGILAYHVIRIG